MKYKKKNDNDSFSSGEDINSDNVVEYLRNKIIEEIKVRPSLKYKLESNYGEHVSNIFPGGQPWYSYNIFINLETGELSVDLSTYPNQFGACREGTYPLTASDLYQITKDYKRNYLKLFETEDDWAKLFDKKLKNAVSIASKKLQKEAEKQKKQRAEEYKIEIPKDMAKCWPSMDIVKVVLVLNQPYAFRQVEVIRKKRTYHLQICSFSKLSSNDRGGYFRVATRVESVWIEKLVEKAINDNDNSTWESARGGDTMNITIVTNNSENDISFQEVRPINKYSDLMRELELFVQYGSK